MMVEVVEASSETTVSPFESVVTEALLALDAEGNVDGILLNGRDARNRT